MIYCGGYSGEVPPLPIPNREVKLTSADGTAPPGGRVGSCRFSGSPIDVEINIGRAFFFFYPGSVLVLVSSLFFFFLFFSFLFPLFVLFCSFAPVRSLAFLRAFVFLFWYSFACCLFLSFVCLFFFVVLRITCVLSLAKFFIPLPK